MTDDAIVLSSSSVDTFLRCGHRYYLSEVMRVFAPPNIAMALGTAIHAGVERLLKNSPLRPVDALDEAFAREVALIPAPDEDPAVALADGHTMLTTYTRERWPHFKPALVEQKFVIEVEGVHWTGIIDAADEDVVDLKSTSGKTINGRKPSFDPKKHTLQVTGYRWGYRALTGNWPRRLLLDVLTRTGKYRQYELQPDNGGLLDVIRLVRRAIMAREFLPNGVQNGSCYQCPYRQICEFSIAKDAA
jgi:CRISPR/Cas system-associated exonuclease Cas4 (RecB family)